MVGPFKAWGGIERKMVILARELDALGVGADMVVLRGNDTPYPELLPSSTEVIHLGNRSKVDGAWRFARYLRRCRPDAVVTTQDHAAKVAILGRALSGQRVPLFVKATNTLSQTIRRRGQRLTTRWLYPWADGVIAISEGVRDDLLAAFALPADKVHVVYNPMVTPDFPQRVERVPTHPWFDPNSTVPVIVAAGRLTRQKGFDVLISAFGQLRMTREARLVVLGEGQERPRLEALVGELGLTEVVDLVGFVDDPVPFMARASLFVLSSRWEGLGNVLVEALAAGCPLVATDCPSGPAEILEHGRHGELVPVDDVPALTAAMVRALSRPKRASPDAIDRFRSRAVAKRYLELLGIQVGDARGQA